MEEDDIAILPLKKADMTDSAYKGNEYMQIYPYIAYYEGFELYTNGNHVPKGYYVVTDDEKGNRTIEPLENWLNR